jgi:hypothetical protein
MTDQQPIIHLSPLVEYIAPLMNDALVWLLMNLEAESRIVSFGLRQD